MPVSCSKACLWAVMPKKDAQKHVHSQRQPIGMLESMCLAMMLRSMRLCFHRTACSWHSLADRPLPLAKACVPH
eukprot:scaffold310790_cov24-Tisochrysis_lutea.AAC.1